MKRPKMRGWERDLWAVKFTSRSRVSRHERPMMIGRSWNRTVAYAGHDGEPSRPLLFTTRKACRDWCAALNAKWRRHDSITPLWTATPVRVRETVRPAS